MQWPHDYRFQTKGKRNKLQIETFSSFPFPNSSSESLKIFFLTVFISVEASRVRSGCYSSCEICSCNQNCSHMDLTRTDHSINYNIRQINGLKYILYNISARSHGVECLTIDLKLKQNNLLIDNSQMLLIICK